MGLGLTKYPEARAMLDAGCRVFLATDFNPGSSPVKSLPMVMALACRYMKMTPMEALTACTRTAADSLNLAEKGSLSIGSDADFVLWDAADYRELAYWIPGPRANQVWIAGLPMLVR
jgi:imidazolonepropionase